MCGVPLSDFVRNLFLFSILIMHTRRKNRIHGKKKVHCNEWDREKHKKIQPKHQTMDETTITTVFHLDETITATISTTVYKNTI